MKTIALCSFLVYTIIMQANVVSKLRTENQELSLTLETTTFNFNVCRSLLNKENL